MNKTLLALAFVLSAAAPGVARAQSPTPSPAPAYIPFTVDEKDWDQLHAWLNDQPRKVAEPIWQWLSAMEQRVQAARAEKEHEAKKKAEGHAPAPDAPRPEGHKGGQSAAPDRPAAAPEKELPK